MTSDPTHPHVPELSVAHNSLSQGEGWSQSPLRLCVFGAAPDTGNLGVSALCHSVLSGLTQISSGLDLTVFDYSRGTRQGTLDLPEREVSFRLRGAAASRRYYRSENLTQMHWAAWLKISFNPGSRLVAQSDAVLDISGGDSFTDLYGDWRFKATILPKLIALRMHKPLILLPQTYGPFARKENFRKAAELARGAAMAWARDERSFEALRDLLGKEFDPARHRCGVDVAFGLEAIPPALPLPEDLARFLGERHNPMVGVNVSGLLFNNSSSKDRYALKADYDRVILDLLNKLLTETDCRVILVPHVVTPGGHYESDLTACRTVHNQLKANQKDRCIVAPAFATPGEVKWLIGQMDWFCGTRMHSTIAGLSSGVPTAAIAYSLKTQGVFESCGQGDHVADPRSLDTASMLDKLWESWLERLSAKDSLRTRLPFVIEQSSQQLELILRAIVDLGRNPK